MATTIDITYHQKISQIISKETAQLLVNSLSNLTGAGMTIFDGDGNEFASSSSIHDYCNLQNMNQSYKDSCIQTRKNLPVTHENYQKKENSDNIKVTNHLCFSGLSYSITSLIIEDQTIGYLALGPYLKIQPGYNANQQISYPKAFEEEIALLMLQSSADILNIIMDLAIKVSVTTHMQFLTMEENYRNLLEKNKELTEIKIKLEELDRLKSNLLSTISHELRTPLTSIIGYSDMLLGQIGGTLTKEQERFVKTINEKGGVLLSMINKILDVASIEAARFEMAKERVNASGLVRLAIEKIRNESPRVDVKIEFASEDENLTILGDPTTLEKAIYHLIDNAMKFSPPGGLVQVQIRRVNPEVEDSQSRGFVILAPTLKAIEIMVRDFGPGIPEGLKEKIFEPFFQADDSATRSYGGLGLGLALVKQYLWANKGSIKVESSEGGGATFLIRLPLYGE